MSSKRSAAWLLFLCKTGDISLDLSYCLLILCYKYLPGEDSAGALAAYSDPYSTLLIGLVIQTR